MNKDLAIEILKQASLETETGACEYCPRKDKNKTCIGCLDEAKEKTLLEIERLHSIIKEVRELRKKISNLYYEDGFDLDTPMLLKYIDEILDKENKDNI